MTNRPKRRAYVSRFLEGLPEDIRKKIGKTKQTRGAQPYDRVPYQNRVNRTGIAVVPYRFRNTLHPDGFIDGYRVMVKPDEYFEAPGVRGPGFDPAVEVGRNAFVYYDSRRDWRRFPPPADWIACPDRSGTGHYIARVPATTATDADEAREVVAGEPQGIRFFEYASPTDLERSIAQLSWLAWLTEGIDAVRTDGEAGIPKTLQRYLDENDLAVSERFLEMGAIVRHPLGGFRAVCPLCRAVITAKELMSRVEQMEGREVVDLTITEVNLFHIKELRPGEYNHRPYNLAWGHHHCNAVARDNGVGWTIDWMQAVLRRHGFDIQPGRGDLPIPDLPQPVLEDGAAVE